MTYLIDTDVNFDAMSSQPEALGALEVAAEVSLRVSIITLGEVYDGVSRLDDPPDRLRQAERFLQPFHIINLDDQTMRIFGRIRTQLRQRGRIIGDMDILIAATAINQDLLLVTRNWKHFSQVDGLRFESPAQVLRN